MNDQEYNQLLRNNLVVTTEDEEDRDDDWDDDWDDDDDDDDWDDTNQNYN